MGKIIMSGIVPKLAVPVVPLATWKKYGCTRTAVYGGHYELNVSTSITEHVYPDGQSGDLTECYLTVYETCTVDSSGNIVLSGATKLTAYRQTATTGAATYYYAYMPVDGYYVKVSDEYGLSTEVYKCIGSAYCHWSVEEGPIVAFGSINVEKAYRVTAKYVQNSSPSSYTYSVSDYIEDVSSPVVNYPQAEDGYVYVTQFTENGITYTVMENNGEYYCYAPA